MFNFIVKSHIETKKSLNPVIISFPQKVFSQILKLKVKFWLVFPNFDSENDSIALFFQTTEATLCYYFHISLITYTKSIEAFSSEAQSSG